MIYLRWSYDNTRFCTIIQSALSVQQQKYKKNSIYTFTSTEDRSPLTTPVNARLCNVHVNVQHDLDTELSFVFTIECFCCSHVLILVTVHTLSDQWTCWGQRITISYVSCIPTAYGKSLVLDYPFGEHCVKIVYQLRYQVLYRSVLIVIPAETARVILHV